MTNITVAANTVTAGAGGAAGPAGYSVYPTTSGANGTNGLPGTAMGSAIGSVGATNTLKNSILSPNHPTDTNIFGSFVDAGNNISFDNQHSLTNSTSYNGINPILAPLGNYGGPTPTMALLPGSPAIDHADVTAFPATDQRGFPRPYGSAPDIGAFEYPPMNEMIIRSHAGGMLDLVFAGTNGQTFSIQASVDFKQWIPITTNTLGASDYLDTIFPMTNNPGLFFRAVSP
jgi:hypothetical protein